jgi:hypothetical protein
MIYYNEEGLKIEGLLTQAEVDAQIAAAKVVDQKAGADAEAAMAVAEAAKVAAIAKVEDTPAWATSLIERLQVIENNGTKTYINNVTSMLDADKKKEVEAKFNQLTGYENSPEGLTRRAEDAHLLTTGERYNANSVDLQNLTAAGGGRTNVSGPAVTEVDKGIQSVLGITGADVEKFGKK